ncbi:bifunctional UDP-sugar hydrolase/5'-nucleotidase [uncultured Sanguibacteroides sp.]|uniref:bifunctional metallophosphatase/5'-nucleotidase n=1 Tax=uncultured Sanguibacteroides sp. TaxID=1635151 RepID=UPI0025DEF408|nr:bifunctional UDP-sugar hydrolase/5'-nucleotidase [uncultured Sanguibacteroides sp.]
MKQRKIFNLYFILLVVVVMFGCSNNKKSSKSGEAEIVIISTNDMHAQISQFPKFATFVKEIRETYPNVILVDAGDRFSGSPFVDHAKERGKPMIELMNKLGYDLATMGNHDFDYGQTELKKRLSEAQFKVICANIRSEGSELGQLPPYLIIEKAGIKLCFLSFIEISPTSHIPATNPEHLEGIVFADFKDEVDTYRKLKNESDAFIGLTHLGVYADSVLAAVMPELDVIIGGHSHTLLKEPKMVNGVLISQTGSRLHYAGITVLKFEKGKLTDKSYRVVDLAGIENPDAEVVAMIETYSNDPDFKVVIGKAAEPMKYKENVASMVTDAMVDQAGCDFAFYNSGGIRLNTIPEGDITKGMVYQIEPFDNYVVKHELSLPEMKELILNRFNSETSDEYRHIDLFISRGSYTILQDKTGKGVDVVFKDKDGRKLTDGHRYKIGLSNYVSTTYDFSGKGKGEKSLLITEAVIRYLQKVGTVTYNKKRTYINPK